MADFALERSCARDGCRVVAGVDEVGRGALCGPVVAAAVVFPLDLILSEPPDWIVRTDDSKRLTPRLRSDLGRRIAAAAAVGIGLSPGGEVDRLNVFHASHAAMRRAVAALPVRPDLVLVDGVPLRLAEFRQRAVPHGDRISTSIAAASIVAKVLRDALLVFSGRLFAGYDLARHKGYGTAGHYRALDDLGPTPFHRRSFSLQSERTLFE
ncbi:MAG: ribonuclease HII [Acidobacteriota bacterium]|nr:ribonuclease HII [Acidobacteriota bacterium]